MATHGLSADGWTVRQAHDAEAVRARPAGAWTIELTLAASRFSGAPIDFVLRGGGTPPEYGKVDPGGARPPVRLTLCVPAIGYAEAWLTSNGRARLPDGRTVALHVDHLSVRRAGPCEPR